MTHEIISRPSSGSRWQRWEPHVHTPGTLFNDQFGSSWNEYLTKLESTEPPIRALGVTDYYLLDRYRAVRDAREQGRLQGCELIFANVEMRLALGTVKGSWVNLHLLVSPEDPQHLDEIGRFLARLTFSAHGDSFNCRPDDLMRLGRKADPAIDDETAALRRGAEQFKVSFDQLREKYRESQWAKENVLIAVAGTTYDGTSGLREGSDQTLRQEVERFGHIIFASSQTQRDYWLGRKTSSKDILDRYDSLKPCLHGSDGHSLDRTGNPDGARYSWIKGSPIFDALRQACIDPEGRAYVGEEPPLGAAPSEVISSIFMAGTPWAKTRNIALNPGLVAIIGARGSGKTALADIVAAGCDSHGATMPKKAFLARAREHLAGARVRLAWESGESEVRKLDGSDPARDDNYPRARYLTQQFVDELCAADGMTDGLLSEVERVIFESHPVSERDGAVDFADLRDMRGERHRQARKREEQGLAHLSERISSEIEKTKLVDGYANQIKDKLALIGRLTTDRSKLVAKGSEERAAKLDEVTKAAERVRGFVRAFKAREQQLLLLQDEVSNVRTHEAPEKLRDTQARHPNSGIKEENWTDFLLRFTGDVDSLLTTHLERAKNSGVTWKGTARPPPADPAVPLIAADAELERQPLTLLEAEIERLQKVVSVDADTARRFKALSDKIISETELLNGLREKLADCKEAKGRLKLLLEEREATYVRVFQAVVAEQQVLSELYAPIQARLEAADGALRKLSFSVARTADVPGWAKQGEDLLDLRVQGPFRGRGALCQVAEKMLKGVWETGDAEAMAAAMKSFREAHQDDLLQHAPVPRTEQEEYRSWSRRFATWLYGTEHISVRSSVDYDGIDIRKLSPGTRGIVLLLLYLALDDADERPLIIDQPEENLDPKSIYDELVDLFLAAKAKRQVIMVTHNANLVINTDADQIIVAEAGPQPADSLPPITYVSGGLESSEIRKMVCDILEGGEVAFRERARRLRVRLDR